MEKKKPFRNFRLRWTKDGDVPRKPGLPSQCQQQMKKLKNRVGGELKSQTLEGRGAARGTRAAQRAQENLAGPHLNSWAPRSRRQKIWDLNHQSRKRGGILTWFGSSLTLICFLHGLDWGFFFLLLLLHQTFGSCFFLQWHECLHSLIAVEIETELGNLSLNNIAVAILVFNQTIHCDLWRQQGVVSCFQANPTFFTK